MRLIGLVVFLALILSHAPLAAQTQPVRLPLVAILEPGLAAAPSYGTGFFKRALVQLEWADGPDNGLTIPQSVLVRANEIIHP